MPTRPRPIEARRARLYESIRTAHLERARELEPAAIVYRVTRYDFDPLLAAGLELIRATPRQTADLVRRSRLEVLEINEPLMLSALPTTVAALLAISVRPRGRRPEVVTYAIGNDDPFRLPQGARRRTRIRRRLERTAARWVWSQVDRIAYGTQQARDVYESLLGPAPGPARLIEALPAPCTRDEPGEDAESVVFLGSFAERKGLPLLLESWSLVRAEQPAARLTVVGKGTLLPLVEAAVAADDSIRLILDPPRDAIHDVLASSRVLVLPSQPTAAWREQVGLPIVEGLQHGCAIVTTDETGLAPWLAASGHAVLPGRADAAQLAGAIAGQLSSGPRSADIRTSLPAEDGRLAADRWLMMPGTPASR